MAGFFDLGIGRHTVLLGTLPRVVTLSAKDGAAGPWVSATVALIVAESDSPGPASTIVMQRLADVLFVQALTPTQRPAADRSTRRRSRTRAVRSSADR